MPAVKQSGVLLVYMTEAGGEGSPHVWPEGDEIGKTDITPPGGDGGDGSRLPSTDGFEGPAPEIPLEPSPEVEREN